MADWRRPIGGSTMRRLPHSRTCPKQHCRADPAVGVLLRAWRCPMNDADGPDPVASPMTAAIREFLVTLLGPRAEQCGPIGGGWARVWREQNLLAIKDHYDRIVRDRTLDPAKRVPLAWSVGLPLIEKASYQDNAFLQEKWAHLIASLVHADNRSEHGFSLDMTYVELLHQFSQLDCEILAYLAKDGIESIDPDVISHAYPNTSVHLSLEKLVILGCATRVSKSDGGTDAVSWRQDIMVTLIGLKLYIAAFGVTPNWFAEEMA